ncbi:hypothetical protein [Streptomyces peucetius]|uniref:PPM-type phosphatase domain-containing protein n=1 Tax=Streptomyces peucetius TaxID=1950 RepID=A0ABY6IF84_STRPE|nr:hypothetical protein [Streptomyces peucetius]UYQ65675.1 hypothetical protein OGH68_32280 [Streptomyces peucetius]
MDVVHGHSSHEDSRWPRALLDRIGHRFRPGTDSDPDVTFVLRVS